MTSPSLYATEHVAFGDLTIAFDARVLTPRPWTLAQSEWGAELLPRLPAGPVLELCCGAGQIGLAAVRHSERTLVCVDADPVALEYAVANATAAACVGRVQPRLGLVDQVLSPEETFPLVIADPPWVPTAVVPTYPEDPTLAIDGGADGLDVARRCVAVVGRHLAPGGAALLQLGTIQQAAGLVAETAELVCREVREYERGVVVLLVHG